MTDLEINIALAKAMGWRFLKPNGSYSSMRKTLLGLFCWDTEKYGWRKFDYRDPVIFVAICKHWQLACWFCKGEQTVMPFKIPYGERFYDKYSIEKAAALCVIDTVKRGVK